MNNAIRYLEASKIEELCDKLSAEGYRVTRPSIADAIPFDLIAEKAGKRIAYNVKARSSLKSSLEEILARQQYAREHGIESARLVVVNPPHQTDAKVIGLERALASHFINHLPEDLQRFIERWRGDGISGLWVPGLHDRRPDVEYVKIAVRQIDLDKLHVTDQEIMASGEGLIVGTVRIYEELPNQPRKPVSFDVDTPFTFDVTLDRDMRVRGFAHLSVDTSSWEGTVSEPELEPNRS